MNIKTNKVNSVLIRQPKQLPKINAMQQELKTQKINLNNPVQSINEKKLKH